MNWDTTKPRGTSHPVPPETPAASGVEFLIGCTIGELPTYDVDRPAPAGPGVFGPAYPRFWELGDGMWGRPGPNRRPGEPPVIGKVIAQSPRAYLEHLIDLPPEPLAGYSLIIEGAHAYGRFRRSACPTMVSPAGRVTAATCWRWAGWTASR